VKAPSYLRFCLAHSRLARCWLTTSSSRPTSSVLRFALKRTRKIRSPDQSELLASSLEWTMTPWNVVRRKSSAVSSDVGYSSSSPGVMLLPRSNRKAAAHNAVRSNTQHSVEPEPAKRVKPLTPLRSGPDSLQVESFSDANPDGYNQFRPEVSLRPAPRRHRTRLTNWLHHPA